MNIFLLPTLYVWSAGDHDVLPEPEVDFDEGL
jgi:cobalt-zinc-cadmium resistance protein CzcA